MEDEALVAKGISRFLLQSHLNVKKVDIALNGFEALDYIRMESYDLVLSDIQMSGMNGLELMEALLMEDQDLPVIFITAHEDFDYAKHALRLGAKDYLVKPVEFGQLIQVTGGVLEGREQARKKKLEQLVRDKYKMDDMLTMRTCLLQELVSGYHLSETERRGLLEDAGIRLEGPFLCVLAMKLDLDKGGFSNKSWHTVRDRNLMQYAALNVAEECMRAWDAVSFYGSDGLLAILQWNEPLEADSHHKELRTLCESIEASIKLYLNVDSSVACSTVGKGIDQLPMLYRDAIRLADERAEAGGRMNTESEDDPEQAALTDDNFPTKERDHAVIRQAVNFVKANYANKGLKLQDIANAVHVSPNYLSYLFKKMKGINLWDYLTDLRMEEAKRLLIDTDLKRYHIADTVGYESPEHFSRIFKRYYGVSPAEFRK